LLGHFIRILAILATDAENAKLIVHNNGVQSLVELLYVESNRIQLLSAGTLGNIAAHDAENQTVIRIAQAIPPLVDLLNSWKGQYQGTVIDTLVRLAKANNKNCEFICYGAAAVQSIVEGLDLKRPKGIRARCLTLIKYLITKNKTRATLLVRGGVLGKLAKLAKVKKESKDLNDEKIYATITERTRILIATFRDFGFNVDNALQEFDKQFPYGCEEKSENEDEDLIDEEPTDYDDDSHKSEPSSLSSAKKDEKSASQKSDDKEPSSQKSDRKSASNKSSQKNDEKSASQKSEASSNESSAKSKKSDRKSASNKSSQTSNKSSQKSSRKSDRKSASDKSSNKSE